MTDFRFDSLIDFSHSGHTYVDLMQFFEATQKHNAEATKMRDKAKLEYQQWQEYHDLHVQYQELFGSLIKKLLDAKTTADIAKVRANHNNKLVPLLKKLDLIIAKISQLPTPAQVESQNSFESKVNKLQELMETVTQMKDSVEVMQ